MATYKIGNDLPGSFFNRGHNDTRKDRAVRRLMYHHDGDKAALLDAITLGSIGETFNVSTGAFLARASGIADDQGNPTFTGGELVHPEDTTIPLQTTKVTKVGKDRWVAILTYYRTATTEPGGPGGPDGGATNANSLVKIRGEYEAHKVYTDGLTGEYDWMTSYGLPGGNMLMNTIQPCRHGGDSGGDTGDGSGGRLGTPPRRSDDDAGGGEAPTVSGPIGNPQANPEAYARIIVLPVIKILLPFATPLLPFSRPDLLGTLNRGLIQFGGYGQANLQFAAGTLRFDGVQMDELGSFVDANGQSARFFGSYMFSSSATGFYSQIPRFCNGRWGLDIVQSNVNTSGAYASVGDLGL